MASIRERLLADGTKTYQVQIRLRGKKPIARMIPCSQLPNKTRPQVGTVTSKSIKIVEKREVAGRVGDTVVYF